MKEGALIGAFLAFLVYLTLPIYNANGAPAGIFPTGNVISDSTGFGIYVTNLPYSTIIFFALEVMGISCGIISQMVFRKYYRVQQ
jgi:hypothetical protein